MNAMPTLAAAKVTDITPEVLHRIHVSAVILDVDNTLSAPSAQTPYPGTVEWVKNLRQSGFKVVILSNNFKRRVGPFAAQYELSYISMGLKPLPFSFRRALRHLGSKREETVVVGDQVFTDILGANLAGLKSILLTPQTQEKGKTFEKRRDLENKVRAEVLKKGLMIPSKEET